MTLSDPLVDLVDDREDRRRVRAHIVAALDAEEAKWERDTSLSMGATAAIDNLRAALLGAT